MNCDKPFDGVGGELAHSWAAGDVHFDDDENYRREAELHQGLAATGSTSSPPATSVAESAISLQKLAVHEVGHVLGLLHNDRQQSIMYPIYVSPSSHEDFELFRDDRLAVQQIYGVCKVFFHSHFVECISVKKIFVIFKL
jgi:matrix metalloproteinase-21